MSYSSIPPQKPRKYGCVILILLLLVVPVIYSGVRFLLDRSSYSRGHQAYQQADCEAAIGHFDNVINGWRMADFGDYAALARVEKDQCQAFQEAVDKQQAGNSSGALVAHTAFIISHEGSVLADAARTRIESLFEMAGPAALASQESCGWLETILGKNLMPRREDNLPAFYLGCGKVYDAANDWQDSYALYVLILSNYPSHPAAAGAEASLLGNFTACGDIGSLKNNSLIASRTEFLPRLYFNCGQAYEIERDWTNAATMYENFMADFPGHARAAEAETALARTIVEQADSAGAGEIAAPERSGSTSSGSTVVVIQNDSPERLRIVFSGPESKVEEMEACSSCTTYTGSGPLFCPELGPIARYTLPPGTYNVVVEATSNRGVEAWRGSWDLVDGDEYSSCFYEVTTLYP
jgi:hypothetical protein